MDEIENKLKDAFFDLLKDDFNQSPPKTEHITKCLHELVKGLCKMVPSKTHLHDQIKQEIIYETIDVTTMPNIVNGLIKWIETFQAPIHDPKTQQWRREFNQSKHYPDFLSKFLREYYEHTETVYKEIWECRERLIRGENLVPPKYRTSGQNGIPDIMRTGH